MSAVIWLGCDLVTGKIVEELPDLIPSGDISHLLAAYTNAAFTLPIPLGGHGAAPQNWQAATEPGRSMIVAVLGDQPIWAGIVLPRTRGSDPTTSLGCVSLEGYLDRRYVGDHIWTGQDESSVIMAGLFGDANTVEGIGFTVDAPATGVLRDRTYKDRDNKTVYSAARELAGVISGPEWTIALGWTDSTQTAVSKTLRVRKRIGFASVQPNAVFSTEGESEARYVFSEDYGGDKGANHVIAESSGEGDARPRSAPVRDEALFAVGWPRYEYRYNAAEGITKQSTLDEHAQGALARMARGARLITITARADAYPRLGVDWTTGDDVGFQLVGHGHPDGLSGVGRAIGWTLNPLEGIVSPILLDPGVEVTE